jgi:hypothetical protein
VELLGGGDGLVVALLLDPQAAVSRVIVNAAAQQVRRDIFARPTAMKKSFIGNQSLI